MGKKYLLNKYYGSLEENYDEKKKKLVFWKTILLFYSHFLKKSGLFMNLGIII